jgi:hypothetical protein
MPSTGEILRDQVTRRIRLWSLFNPPSHMAKRLTKIPPEMDLALIATPEYGKIVVLFTDPDPALKLQGALLPDLFRVATFPSAKIVRMVLKLWAVAGVKHVGIDYAPATDSEPASGEVISIDRAIDIYGERD